MGSISLLIGPQVIEFPADKTFDIEDSCAFQYILYDGGDS